MFHGNAGNIGHRIPIAQVLEVSLGCTVLMLEYRGYGTSTGTPDEKGLAIDAQTGLDFIRSCEELKGHRIVIYGQSLGGAVATQLVVNNQEQGDIKALLLENTFTSIRDIIPAWVPPSYFHEYILTNHALQRLPTCEIPRSPLPPILANKRHHRQDQINPNPLPVRSPRRNRPVSHLSSHNNVKSSS